MAKLSSHKLGKEVARSVQHTDPLALSHLSREDCATPVLLYVVLSSHSNDCLPMVFENDGYKWNDTKHCSRKVADHLDTTSPVDFAIAQGS